MAGLGFFAGRFLSLSFTRQTKLFCESLKRSSVLRVETFQMRGLLERRYATYEADGKTVGFVVNKKTAEALCISGIRTYGFVMANGEEYAGPLILFPHSVLSWHVHSVEDINEKSMVLFKVLEPSLDILILGYGARNEYTPEIHRRFSEICSKLGIRFEALPTEQAAGVFNFLALEHRFVAGAFIPPKVIDVQKLDRSKKFYLDDLDDEEEKSDFDLLEEKEDKKLLR